jgi:signal transduction histidine kinase
LPDKFPTLMGDKKLLKTALINILGNAVKYTPENGKIAFSLNDDDEMVHVTVTDTGYGISEEELPRIFEKFNRSEDPKVREQTGAGLGLAVTSEIIHLRGGDISVESV